MSSTDDSRRLNDELRRSQIGEVRFSAGLVALFAYDLAAIAELVRAFNDFTEDNDPYGEHDFGSFEFKGQTINWKIDSYAATPRSAAKRVLTILLALEY